MRIVRIKQRTIYLTICLLIISLVSTGLSIVPRAVSTQSVKQVGAEQTISLPIIMYHSILKDPARAGEYVISPDQLEADLQYLQKSGYQWILSQDLIDYVYNGGTLPEKPILITFDDGYYNNYYYAFPLLQKYGAKAILSPIAIESERYSETKDENPNYAHCSWQVLREMHESGLVEIANHSYNLHQYGNRQGAKITAGENSAAYRAQLTADTQKAETLLETNVGCSISAYTYPFGSFCPESEACLQEMGYRVTYITEDRVNLITKDPDCLYQLKRYKRPAGISTEEFMAKIQSQGG